MKAHIQSIFTITLVIFVLTLVAYAQWQCPKGCSCANNIVSVTCFGAVADDGVGDGAAIQNALNNVPDYWSIYFPAGVYIVDVPLRVQRNNLSLYGVGIQSELRTPQGTNYPLLNFPREDYTIGCPQINPSNITIEKLSFNGNMNTGTEACPLESICNVTTGIWIREGEDITFRDVLIKDFGLEGISISNGGRIPKNISMDRVRFQRIRRTAVHFGMGENLVLQNSSIEDMGADAWLPAAVGNPAVDIETEGLDLGCPEGSSPTYHDAYVLNTVITNTMFFNPTSTQSKGAISISPAYGPVRGVTITNNVFVNTSGIATLGVNSFPVQYGVANPQVGQSRLIRQLDVSSNWLANLHPNQPPYDLGTHAFQFVLTGDNADSYGSNGVQLNDNVMTVFIDGGNNRAMGFSGIKELYGSNNKDFRPYHDTSNNPLAGNINFLWRKDFTPSAVSNMQILGTVDNGWPGSRLLCYDPVNILTNYGYDFCSLTGSGNSLTWVDNPNPTPTGSPTITSAFVSGTRIFVAISEPNNQPVRLVVFRNGLADGITTVYNGYAYVRLNSGKPTYGDTYDLKAFNENGWYGDYSFSF